MDSSYCCLMAKEKMENILNSPVEYMCYDIKKLMRVFFSSDWFHTLPSLVFLISIAIALKKRKIALIRPLSRFKKYGCSWIGYILKIFIIVVPMMCLLTFWTFIQEFIYCVVWFLTSEGLNPDLLDKWWFRKDETSRSNENMKSFVEVIPPEILSWIIMILIASFILVITFNGTAKNVTKPRLYDRLVLRSDSRNSSESFIGEA